VGTLFTEASNPESTKIRSQLCPGTPVEYFSVSAEECWIPATVLAYNPEAGLYDLDCKSQVPRSKIRCPDPFPTGALVEYKSSKKNGWFPGRVLSYDASTGLYDLSCGAQTTRRRLRWPTGSHMAVLSENCFSTYLAGGSPLSTLADVGEALDEIDASVIGRNPIEAVFMGCKICDRSNFAAKVISLGVGSDNPAGVREEIQTMSALQQHPNIVKLAGVMVCPRQLKNVSCPGPYLCILMQCLGNMCLLSETIRRGAGKTTFIETVVGQLASALSFVHQQGFVHRNVSSDNIFVNSADQVLLFEFGSASQYTVGADSYAFSNFPYISPEASKRERQHPGEDAWALGLLISEMLTGRFIRERAGDANLPIHCKPEAMSELMCDISFFGSSRIGKICAQLLTAAVAHRMTMVEVVASLSPVEASHASTQASQASTQVPSCASSQVSTPRIRFR
jgi:serine/threonine protein kinase